MCINMGIISLYKHIWQSMIKTADFFAANPVFSLDDAVRELAPAGGRVGAVERLKYHVETGRLRSVSKGVYVVTTKGFKHFGKQKPDTVIPIEERVQQMAAKKPARAKQESSAECKPQQTGNITIPNCRAKAGTIG